MSDFLSVSKNNKAEMNPELKLVFLHYKREVFCKSVLKLSQQHFNYLTKTVSFMKAMALNPRQFVALLKEHESEHGDISYHKASGSSAWAKCSRGH